MKKKSQKTTFFRFFATFSTFAWIQMRPFCGPAPQTISCLRRYSNSTYIIHMSLAHNNIRARGANWCAEKFSELKIFQKKYFSKKNQKFQIFLLVRGTLGAILFCSVPLPGRALCVFVLTTPPLVPTGSFWALKVGCSRRFVDLPILTLIQRCTSPKYTFGWVHFLWMGIAPSRQG